VSVPQHIGRYVVERPLGSGAFAMVWLGHDQGLDDRVAIKVLSDNWTHQLDIRDRFLEEARVLRRARSERVVQVFDIGQMPDGRPYFVMSYADRGSLTDRRARIGVATALRHGADIALGVADLHRAGIMHRDIKPSNVLFRADAGGVDRLMIADLGLSKRLADASGFTLAAGTPGYMAPEQSSGLDLDHRVDVYGVGATVYDVLTGQKPAPAGAVPPSTLRPGLPAGTDEVLLRALAPDRDDRWPTVLELAKELAALAAAAARLPAAPPAAEAVAAQPVALDDAEVTTQLPAARPADRTPALPTKSRPRWVRWAAGAAAVLVAAGIAAVVAAPWEREPGADLVEISDDGGRIRLTVPAGWAGQRQGGGWLPTDIGLKAADPGPAVAVAGDLDRWRDQANRTPGVFVGLSGDAELPGKALALRHDDCREGSPTRRQGTLTGQVVRWTCADGITFDEAGLRTSGGTSVYVQIKQPAGEPDRAEEILASIRIR
jgi:eukaryotic-like serine/threonine-protein kinase